MLLKCIIDIEELFMRIKKGFTLAEILIVLMVIGVIATMTIPSLMKGVAEAQYKAAYKKGAEDPVKRKGIPLFELRCPFPSRTI